jgi:hypothetical protein
VINRKRVNSKLKKKRKLDAILLMGITTLDILKMANTMVKASNISMQMVQITKESSRMEKDKEKARNGIKKETSSKATSRKEKFMERESRVGQMVRNTKVISKWD